MDKKLIKTIVKEIGSPIDFFWDNIEGTSIKSDISRMREYVEKLDIIEKQYKRQYGQRSTKNNTNK